MKSKTERFTSILSTSSGATFTGTLEHGAPVSKSYRIVWAEGLCGSYCDWCLELKTRANFFRPDELKDQEIRFILIPQRPQI